MKLISIILFIFAGYLIRAAIIFEDEEAAGCLTKIRLFGVALLVLILAIGFLFTDKPFCELFSFFCK